MEAIAPPGVTMRRGGSLTQSTRLTRRLAKLGTLSLVTFDDPKVYSRQPGVPRQALKAVVNHAATSGLDDAGAFKVELRYVRCDAGFPGSYFILMPISRGGLHTGKHVGQFKHITGKVFNVGCTFIARATGPSGNGFIS